MAKYLLGMVAAKIPCPFPSGIMSKGKDEQREGTMKSSTYLSDAEGR